MAVRPRRGEARLERGGDGTIELGVGALSTLYTGYASPWPLASAGLLHGGSASDHAALGRRVRGADPLDARLLLTRVDERGVEQSRERPPPSVVFEITVCVIARAGSCTLRNETPASMPTKLTIGSVGWIQNPSP